MNKIINVLIITIFLTCIIFGSFGSEVYAAQVMQKYSSSVVKSYPGYASLIDSLKKAHPNWTFTILNTGLEWNQVIKNETTALHGRSLIDGSKTGEWICSKCAANKYDNGSWKCASEAAVSYYMDPRNSLNEDYIFQFENLTWVDGIYTVAGVEKILADCKYMQGSKITYKTTSNKTATINKSYAQVIYNAGKKYKVSPYHLASRIRQEQGPGKSASSTATGSYSGYTGYYNFFNINAYGSGSSTIIKNALNYAKNQGWTDPEKSITGGAKFVADEYITQGQSTLYLQKFDVDNSDGSLYWHQYMQNVAAAKSESSSILKTYKTIDSKLKGSFNFIIPVYNNMPSSKCPQPKNQNNSNSGTASTNTLNTSNQEIVKVICNGGLWVRSQPTTSASTLTCAEEGESLVRLKKGVANANGYIWDKIATSDGIEGYVARGNANEEFIKVVSTPSSSATSSNNESLKGTGFKTSGSTVLCEPKITVDSIKKSNSNALIYNVSGKKITSGSLGTGFTIKLSGKTYTVIKKGDVDGDCKVTAGDYVKVKNNIMGKSKLGNNAKSGADVDGDGKVTAGDYVKIKNNIMGKSSIKI